MESNADLHSYSANFADIVLQWRISLHYYISVIYNKTIIAKMSYPTFYESLLT